MAYSAKKYLGIDWGLARIGLALADNETGVAVPYKTVKGLEDIAETVEKEEIDLVILGQPITMSGKGPHLSDFNEFAEKLAKILPVEVKMVDERLSTKAAQRLAVGRGKKKPSDEIAAMLILQTYLDREK